MGEEAEARQDLRGDADAGGDHRGAHEDGLERGVAGEVEQEPAEHEGHDDAEDGDQQSPGPDAKEFGGLHLEAHLEEEEHDAQLGQRVEEVVVGDPAESGGAEEDSGEKAADDGRNAQALTDFGEELGGAEDEQHAEGKVRRAGRGE